MYTTRKIFAFLIFVALLLSFSSFAYAIGFNAEEVYNSVVVVLTDEALGSGFAVGANCIVTNAHVIEDGTPIQIKTYGEEFFRAYVISADSELDIAILGVEGTEFTPLKLADLSTINAGDDVWAIGAPEGLEFTLTKGIISNKNREVFGQTYIQTDAAINHGNSGGPLLNDDGEVLGINSAKLVDTEGIGLAIPVSTIKEYMESTGLKLDENGNVLGVVTEVIKPSPTADAAGPEVIYNEKVIIEYRNTTSFYIVCACLGISVILNIVLILILIANKKKGNSSDRTDFDIEFYN